MGRFSDLDARGLGPSAEADAPSRPTQPAATSSASDFAERSAIGLAGEAALKEHFEAMGWTVSCPVRNNGDDLVPAKPGFLVNGEGRSGLARRFVPLAEADEWVIQNGSPAFYGQRHAVFAPDLRLDRPGHEPRLVEAKTATWLTLIHSKAGLGWRPDYVRSYRALALADAPIELWMIGFGGFELRPARGRQKSKRWGVWTFGADALVNGWRGSHIAAQPELQFLQISDAKKARATVSEAVCKRTLELIRKAGHDPFGKRSGSDPFNQRRH